MISFFNRIGSSWVAKGIFFLLGVSMMAFWGLGGISNTNMSDGTALKVGKNKVSLQEFSRTFDIERNKMAKISGGYMTPKRAIQAGLLDQVVQQLTLRELNNQIQDEVGLIASDESVRRYIEKNPVFKGSLEKFDANLFYAYLSGMNISQAEFAHQMRAELANQHLLRTLERAVPRDPHLMTETARAKKEKREVVSVFLTSENTKTGLPSSQELKDYYEAYIEEFSVPEYRDLRFVSLKPVDFKNDYDKMYKASRQLEDLLGAGKGLKEACEELKLNTGRVFVTDLSGKDKNGQNIKEIAPLLQEAFSLSVGEATSLLDVNNGFVVAGVEKITPRDYKPFDSVRSEVVKLWQREQQKSVQDRVATELLDSLQHGKGWKTYTPTTQVISQTSNNPFPKTVVPALLQQKVGVEYATRYLTEKGILVAYIRRIIPSREEPTITEKQEAVQEWSLDLGAAVQQAYAQKYPIDVHTDAIQKAFSIYDTQDE